MVPGTAEARSRLPLLCIAAGALQHPAFLLWQPLAGVIPLAELEQQALPLVNFNLY